MISEEMIVACCTDLAGKVRGKAFPASQFDKRVRRGVGWTPTNVQITCFDVIAESPFGSLGDLLLLPDAAARVRVDFDDGGPPEHFAIGDIVYTDGRPWELCTRSILKAALERFEKVAGLTLVGAFEHEFQLRDRPPRFGDAYTADGFRAERRLAETVMAAAARGRPRAGHLHEGVWTQPVRDDDGASRRGGDRRPGDNPARVGAGGGGPARPTGDLHPDPRSSECRQRRAHSS